MDVCGQSLPHAIKPAGFEHACVSLDCPQSDRFTSDTDGLCRHLLVYFQVHTHSFGLWVCLSSKISRCVQMSVTLWTPPLPPPSALVSLHIFSFHYDTNEGQYLEKAHLRPPIRDCTQKTQPQRSNEAHTQHTPNTRQTNTTRYYR